MRTRTRLRSREQVARLTPEVIRQLVDENEEVRRPAPTCCPQSSVLSTEGRVVGSCWEKLKPKGPEGNLNSRRQSPDQRWHFPQGCRSGQKGAVGGDFQKLSLVSPLTRPTPHCSHPRVMTSSFSLPLDFLIPQTLKR